MPSFATTYTCPECGTSSNVEVTDLGDPHRHISERTRNVMRRGHELKVEFGREKPGDPVSELAHDLLEQEARFELRYVTCPQCSAKNPEGLEAIRAEQRQTFWIGIVLFGALAVISWFYPKVALILPAMDLLVFRPMMFVQARKEDKPFPVLAFAGGIVVDAILIALILFFPRTAPLMPIVGIVRSFFRDSAKNDWKWDEARKKIRFELVAR